MKRVMLPLLLLASLQAPAVRAEVKAGLGLGSRVNGVEGGSCKAGLCRISGGSDAGRNRFHRMSRFDTRGAIQGVEIQSDGIRNLVLGVTAAEGSFIDKSVSLTAPAHLFLLSPGGIQLMPGSTFLQVPQLTLSTATQLHFPGGIFDVFSTPKADLSPLSGDPFSGRLGLRGALTGEDRPWIRMDGIRIDVEESLLVDAPQGRIDITASQLSASNADGDGGSIALTADLIKVGADSQLLATGQRNGGEVLVGGSWQNSDDTVRQAVQTWMQPGSLVDASSTGEGKGGTVVIWSDLNNPSGGTVAEGTFLATGGPLGGDGGRVETSGAMLIANPERVDVSSVDGLAGEWLLDPFNITINDITPGTGNIVPTTGTGNALFTSTSTESIISTQSLEQSLVVDGNNVRVVTGTGDPSQGGNITWEAGADLDYSSAATNLTLDASGYIQLGSDITTGSGGLTLNAGAGFVEGDATTNLVLNGPLQISTGDVNIGTPTGGSQALASTLSGIGNLTKLGNGRLILSGNNASWEGNTTVSAGALRVTTSNALGDSAPTVVETGASLELSGIIALDEPITLEGGVLRNWSGNNTLKQTLTLNGSSTIDLKQANLSLSPTSGDAVAVTLASNSNLTVEGQGDLLVSGPLNLQDGQQPTKTFGDLVFNGPGEARFQETLAIQRLDASGSGTVVLDQPAGSDVFVGADDFVIGLDGATLRRDVSENITGAVLQLGSDGGTISVQGSSAIVTWDGAISGAGNFSKEGDGTLRFAPSADITYTGATLVKAGTLDVLSSAPTTASCSGSGSSNLCSVTPTPTPIPEVDPPPEVDPTPEVDPLPEVDPKPEVDPLPEVDPKPEPTSDAGNDDGDRSEPLIALDALAEVPVLQLVSQDQRQGTGADQGPSVTNGQAVAIESSNASIPVAVDFSATSVDVASSSEAQAPTLATGPVQTVLPEEQAGLQLQGSDAQATLRAVSALGLDETLDGVVPDSPSVGNIQQTLVEVQQQAQSGLAVVPAVFRVNFTEAQSGFLDLTLVPPKGAVQARRIEVSRARFASLLKDLYRQLSRQESLDVANPESASRQLHQLLIAPMQSSLDAAGITTLLIAADQGLQAVPFSALSDGVSYFGDRYGFALSPSLALTDLRASTRSRGLLAMGASEFETLAPLPLVPQELSKIRDSATTDRYLNDGFTPRSFLERASDPRYSRVHVASHADFRPGGPEKSVLHTGVGPMSMADFAQLRRQRRDVPLDLVVLSACRTMLGDQDSELGFAGLALQAGARSAIGTLWYVDDVVTSAFFVQFYRFLSQGVPKAQALQLTRQAFASGAIQLKGDQVIGEGGEPLLQDLDQSQRRRIAGGVDNPFFWAGIELIGSPW